MLGPGKQLRGICARTKPYAQKKDLVWFAHNEDRPLGAFASIWTEFWGDRSTLERSNTCKLTISAKDLERGMGHRYTAAQAD
jgi:hypothetical protein